jgi:hypothetical protein
MGEHKLTTFIRTKIFFKNRLKDLDDYGTCKVYIYELKKLGCDNGAVLWKLKRDGDIDYDDSGVFRCLRKGPIDPSLLDLVKKKKRIRLQLSDLHVYMKEQLRRVGFAGSDELDIPVYFRAFLEMRKQNLDAFFSVDGFSTRVHTPIVNLKEDLRKYLRLDGEELVSLDVKQMQPLILAKILLDCVGENVFSEAIFSGEDAYVIIQRAARLESRGDAKKMLFRLIFGKPMDGIGKIFHGDSGWVTWINNYKSVTESRNPHKEDKHTNLAWLLQFSEVQIMTGIWEKLRVAGLPFLTIHDDVLVRRRDGAFTYEVMKEVLGQYFPTFVISRDHHC